MKFLILLALVAGHAVVSQQSGHAVVSQQTCDQGAILDCFAGLRSLNTTSPQIFDNFCDVSRAAIVCAEPVVGRCDDETFVSELQKTDSMISDICTPENSMSFSLNKDCLTSPAVTTAMDSCVQTFFQDLSSTDVCFLLDPLEACSKNVVIGCAEDLVDPYSSALVLSIRAHLPSIVICDKTTRPTTGHWEMCNQEEQRCLSPVRNTYFNSSSSLFFPTSELLASFCSAAEKATACFEPFSVACKNHSIYSEFDSFTGYHQYICATENRAGVVALGKCINDNDVFDEVEKCFDGFGNATDPQKICSDTKSSIKCSVEKIRDECGQDSIVVYANIVRQYTGPLLSLYLPADCDALELLDGYTKSSDSGAGAAPTMLIAVTNAALVAIAVMLTSA